jgi:pimeloyl-ACP methyl ester carboxylesterase
MQRPIMNPEFFQEPDAPEARQSPSRLKVWLKDALRGGRALVCLALKRPFMRPSTEPPAPLWYRLAAGLLYRLTVLVILGALVVVVMLTAATHPRAAVAGTDPTLDGLYYDPVSFLSPDGLRLDAWLIPALDARRVLEQKEEALRRKQPAIILVHDFACSSRQMLPLVRPLHEAGFLVLVLNLRGCGSSAASPQTFGLREWMDVKAADDMLRRRPFVDSVRIGAVGLGTGANAVLLAAQNDPGLTTLVLQNPIADINEALDRYALPPALRYPWVQTIFRWTFQSIYHLGSDPLVESAALGGRHILTLKGGLPAAPGAAIQVCRFLRQNMPATSSPG